MKIEKVSDTQLKLSLTKSDLAERHIQLEDLIRPNEKTQQLFRDIMEQAMEQCDFIAENTPLMVEAAPLGMDGIMIIVTKMDGNEKAGSGINLFQNTKESHRYKKTALAVEDKSNEDDSDVLIYSFAELDDVIDVSIRLDAFFYGNSALYKYQERYFLILQGNTYGNDEHAGNIALILDEYGQKHVSTALSSYFLMEHGEVIIKEDAVKSLASSFGNNEA